MTGSSPPVSISFGFGVYVFLSVVLHLLLMPIFMTIDFPSASLTPDKSNKIPVVIKQSSSLDRSQEITANESNELLDPGYSPARVSEKSYESEISSVDPSLRGLTLKASVSGGNPGKKARTISEISISTEQIYNPDYQSLRESFSDESPQLIRRLDEPKSSMLKPELNSSTTNSSNEASESDDSLGFLNPDSLESDENQNERALQSRPSFPYTKAHPHFLNERTEIGLKITIDKSGTVTAVKVSKSSGNEDLDRVIMNWVGKWRYADGTGTVVKNVSVQIPGDSS